MANILNEMQEIYNKHYKEFNYIIYIVFLLVFLLLVLFNPYFLEFNKDEIHAWNIAADLNIIEIIKLMRSEGHGIIWYLILKPFTKNPDLFFPWIIKWLNFVFIFAGLIIFWFKAPIKILFKILITFSFPLLGCLAILGRCYGIGIFLLCLIALNFKNRINRPVLFSVLLFITAHTSLIASIAISGLSIVYTFELFKEKKLKNIVPLCILFLIPVTLYCLWHNPVMPSYTFKWYLKKSTIFKSYLFESYAIIPTPIIPIIIYGMGSVISILFFRHSKSLLASLIITYAICLYFTLKVYGLFEYHYLFMFIAFCCYYWMYCDTLNKNVNNIVKTFFNVWFVCLCIILSPWIKEAHFWFTPNDLLKEKLNCIYENVPKQSTVFASMYSLGHEYPYLKNDYNFKTYDGGVFNSFESYFNLYNFSEKKIDTDKLKRINKKNKFLMININFAEDIGLPENFSKNATKCDAIFIMKLD